MVMSYNLDALDVTVHSTFDMEHFVTYMERLIKMEIYSNNHVLKYTSTSDM